MVIYYEQRYNNKLVNKILHVSVYDSSHQEV